MTHRNLDVKGFLLNVNTYAPSDPESRLSVGVSLVTSRHHEQWSETGGYRGGDTPGVVSLRR